MNGVSEHSQCHPQFARPQVGPFCRPAIVVDAKRDLFSMITKAKEKIQRMPAGHSSLRVKSVANVSIRLRKPSWWLSVPPAIIGVEVTATLWWCPPVVRVGFGIAAWKKQKERAKWNNKIEYHNASNCISFPRQHRLTSSQWRLLSASPLVSPRTPRSSSNGSTAPIYPDPTRSTLWTLKRARNGENPLPVRVLLPVTRRRQGR